MSLVSSILKTEVNWLFNILALLWLSVCRRPLSFRGAMPVLSHLLDLTNFQNGLVLLSSKALLMMLFK